MILNIENLTKNYGKTVALSNFNYTFYPGIYGILGANGAGKSTFFKVLTDTISIDRGSVCWNGKEVSTIGKEYRKKIGYMPQSQGYYKDMSVCEFLNYMGWLKGVPSRPLKLQIKELLQIVDLEETRHCKMGNLSGGMRQRVMLVQALLGNPELLILDEPTAGVDPQERIRIRSYIAAIAQRKIVLIATHIVSDIECIAHQVLLMNKGKLIKSGSPEDLICSIDGKVAERICASDEAIVYQRNHGSCILSQCQTGQVLRIVGDSFPKGFVSVKNGIGLEEVYLYYCV